MVIKEAKYLKNMMLFIPSYLVNFIKSESCNVLGIKHLELKYLKSWYDRLRDIHFWNVLTNLG